MASRHTPERGQVRQALLPAGGAANMETAVPVLIVLAQTRACALPVAEVVETMRPLPLETLPGLPAFVPGLAMIRGTPLPVIDLASLVGASGAAPATRFVTVRAGTHQAALRVECVVGIHWLQPGTLEQLPPLMRHSSSGVIAALGALNQHLLMLLSAGRLLNDALWQQLAAQHDSAPSGAGAAATAPAELVASPAPSAEPASAKPIRQPEAAAAAAPFAAPLTPPPPDDVAAED